MQNDELINMELDTTNKSNLEFTIKPVDDEIKHVEDISIKTE